MNSNSDIQLKVYIPAEASTTTLLLEELPNGHYKLKWNDPFSEDMLFGTIIELEKELDEEGSHILKRIVEKSNYSCESYIFPKEFDYSIIKPVQDAIIAEGGYWEIIFHGMLYVNLPQDSKLDVQKELNRIRGIKNAA
jgi:hypothetical protein